MVKMVDVARLAGVSVKTVSRVLNDEPHVQDQLRERVRKAAQELNYVPSATARSLRSRRSYCLHLLAHTNNSNYVNAIQAGAMQACQDSGYQLMISLLNREGGSPAALFADRLRRLPASGRPDGVILVSPYANDKELSELLIAEDIKSVRVGPHDLGAGALTVMVNEQLAAFELTTHLLTLGHTRIGFVRGRENQNATHERYSGYCRALREADIGVDPSIVMPGTFEFESGVAAGDRLLAHATPPTAIFAANDEMAVGVLFAAHRKGIAVPQTLSVAGFDDSEIAARIWPGLTTIRQPRLDLGAAATRRLIQGITQPDAAAAPTVLPHELILRASTSVPGIS